MFVVDGGSLRRTLALSRWRSVATETYLLQPKDRRTWNQTETEATDGRRNQYDHTRTEHVKSRPRLDFPCRNSEINTTRMHYWWRIEKKLSGGRYYEVRKRQPSSHLSTAQYFRLSLSSSRGHLPIRRRNIIIKCESSRWIPRPGPKDLRLRPKSGFPVSELSWDRKHYHKNALLVAEREN